MPENETAEVLDLIRTRVRIRFELTADQFAEILLTRVRTAGRGDDAVAVLSPLRLDDLYLANACVRRDERAWAECARLHFGFMREFARRFLRGTDASDLVDRVIADLWEKGKLARYEGRSTLRTLLGAVIAHAALQEGKMVRRHQVATERDAAALTHVPAAATAPEEGDAARLLGGIAAEAIRSLTTDQKLLILLHYEQDLSLEEIAPILKSSKATLSRRLKRLRDEVRTTIERVARERYGSSANEVRSRVDLARTDLDLSALLGGIGSVKGSGGGGV